MRLRLCAVGRDGAPLFTGCASTYGVQYTVAAWSFLVLHDTVSVAFTASHTSREFTIYRIGACKMYWRERTTLDCGLGDGSPRASGAYSTAPDRPNGQERSPTAERLGCTGAGSGRGAGAENVLARNRKSENRHLRGAAPSSSIAYRALYAYTLRSTLAKVTVLVLPLPAQPF